MAGRRKRKRGAADGAKLPVGTNVEVRYFDEGLKGSWHPGVVLECKKSIRLVQYSNIMDNDGSSKLMEQIFVSPDVEVDEAWWEGIIFDREEGSNERLVFFPDQGDRDRINVNKLRVTQDWDEVLGDWRLRGDWLFIKLLEKYEGSLPVSVRQIWYDVRCSEYFRHDDLLWMHGEWDLWDKLVFEAVQENVYAACGGKAVPIAGSVSVEDAQGGNIQLSKTYNISKSKFAFQSSYQSVHQDNQVIQPIHTFPSDLSAGIPVLALDAILEDGGSRTHEYRCYEGMSTRSKVSLSSCFNLGYDVTDSVVKFSGRNATFAMANGDLTNEFHKGTDSHCIEGASTCHQPSLPYDLDSASLELAKNLDLEGFDFHSDDAFLATEMPVVANDAQCDVLSTLALPSHPHNEITISDIRTESMFQDQFLSECIGNSFSGEGAGTVHSFGGEDEDLEAIVQDDGGKIDVICVDQVGEPNFKPAFWEGEPHVGSGKEQSQNPPGKDLLPGADRRAIRKHCSCAVPSKKRCGKGTILKVNADLLSLGWDNESGDGKDPLKLKIRYVSPNGNTLFSLPEGIDLKGRKGKVRSRRNEQGCVEDNNNVVCDDQITDSISNPAHGNSKVHHAPSTGDSWKPLQQTSLLKAKYFPLAPTEYCKYVEQENSKNSDYHHHIAKKAKMHLLFMGWKIDFRHDAKKRSRTRYVSPNNKSFMSLLQACMHMTQNDKKCQRTMKECTGVDKKSACKSDAPSVESIRPKPISVAREHVDAEGNCSPSCSENQVANVTKQVLPVFPLSDRVYVRPDHCPQAAKDYLKLGIEKNKDGSVGLALRKNPKLRTRVKIQLLADGWGIRYELKLKQNKLQKNKVKRESYYTSPGGKVYHSLHQAWKAWDADDIARKQVKDPPISMGSKDIIDSATSTESDGCQQLSPRQFGFGSTWSSSSLWSSGLVSGTLQLKGSRTQRRKRDLCLFSHPSELLHNDRNACSPSHSKIVKNAGQDGLDIVAFGDKKRRHSGDLYPAQKLKRRKDSFPVAARCAKANSGFSRRVLRSSNREPHVVALSSSQPTIRTVLSWLIDNDVVLPRQKVSYRHQKDHYVMAEGKITRQGIRCWCCKKVYSLSGFEAHAGSTNRRPAANIFLEDGRSLLQCQLQIVECSSTFKGLRPETDQRVKGDYSCCESDGICSICHYGGDLVLCDYCPSAFHLKCIGLENLPEGKWSCASCQCGICGESEFNADIKQFTEQSILYCDQCEREFHVGCLTKRGLYELQSRTQGNWFCSKRCSKIFVSLQKLLGKSKPTAVKGLSWTILRSKKVNGLDRYNCDVEIEHHSKLCVAASVLHECFVPLIEPRTKSDLVTDIVFNKGSELKRLNFRGFYTMILERGDELISVATIRIHGNEVAEIPLVGTCVQYRRQGMCRLLLNELEKMLSNLSVERLLLPAAPQLLETWINSFGFAKMTGSDRQQLFEFTFLEFQDTTMCQKLLMPVTTNAMESRGTKVRDTLRRSNERNVSEKSITIPEPLQVEVAVPALPPVGVQGYNLHGKGGEDSITLALTQMICPVVAEKMMDPECKFRGLFYRRKKDASKSGLDRTLNSTIDRIFGNKVLKCYMRRSTSASQTSSSGSLVA
ncbi:hypothetical protein AAC387_Pa11g0892 [Persea americana]